jgi:uncharacterized membrane protein YfcA
MTNLLPIFFFIVAVLYAAVGQGGGSGYLAVMGLLEMTPVMMKPVALTLNILVAGIATYKFYRAGYFRGRIFWPIALASIPFAFIGGKIALPASLYQPVVGLSLLYAAFRLFRSANSSEATVERAVPFGFALLAGATIGLLSGLVGIGGGIFLSPLLLLAGWSNTRQTLGISAAFVLVNSASGLFGYLSNTALLPSSMPLWLGVVALGGWLGAEFGSRRLNPNHLRLLLAWMLVLGGTRIILA